MNEEIKELLDIVSEGQNSIQRQQIEDYITNLQQENERLKKLHNEELYRRIKAHQYILKNMIHDPLYQGSEVDGENVINILNGGDE